MKVKFRDWDSIAQFAYYDNGRTAIRLISDDEWAEQIAVATVNLPDVDMPDGHVAIKDYSENQGMLAALQEAGIIGKPAGVVPSGFVEIPICPLLVEP